MEKNEELKISIISFLIPMAGLYIMVVNRFKEPLKSQLAQKWMINGLAASLTAGIIGWMYYNI